VLRKRRALAVPGRNGRQTSWQRADDHLYLRVGRAAIRRQARRPRYTGSASSAKARQSHGTLTRISREKKKENAGREARITFSV